MEEKKRRPRIQRPNQGNPLKERPKSRDSGDENNREGSDKEKQPWQDRSRPYDDRKKWDNDRKPYDRDRKPWQDRNQGGTGDRRPYDRDRNQSGDRKPWQDRNQGERRPYDRDRSQGGGYRKPYDNRGGGGYGKKPFGKRPFKKREEFQVERLPKPGLPSGVDMPLNKYLAHCGLASRRKAVEFIEKGVVTVNGEVKLEPYYRIQKGDVVTCEGKEVQVQERKIYLLLNKPKGIITTTDDERGRPTVLDIVDPHYPERIYPVGRLDRDTTGLLLITNDGDLAAKLTHPSQNVQKHYRIGIDKPLSPADFERIEKGVELDDGILEVNWIRFSEEQPNHDVIELEIVEGRNRVVRRLFESLGYRVRKLDRFYFAGLTKRELQRGSFRELSQREIMMLKHFTGHPSTGKKAEAQPAPETNPAEESDAA
jgi:23S rRNA pseudouridine2605 synthase